jgi:lipopolysaccharide transport system ATP-binding protein
MSAVIQVEGLCKKFIIQHEAQEKYTTLRDVLARNTKKVFSFHRSKEKKHTTQEEFLALNNINFTIQQGDRVGIIGRNGAGKSTLLKILSRITEPSSGTITIRGRVASLLEVGTGFHPELTGRENIFLNGAILGMSRAEIRKKFDEIVAFAEVEKFLDTPVKRYSSGMYVRLAFAVAAHLEPEILIVDEVLAVGDAQFQKKCLGKMEDVSKNEGRTVLFVSHNQEALHNLCNMGIVLNKGGLVCTDTIEAAMQFYLHAVKSEVGNTSLKLSNEVEIAHIKVCNPIIDLNGPLVVQLVLLSKEYNRITDLCFLVYDTYNSRVAIIDLRQDLLGVKDQQNTFSCEIQVENLPFIEGRYSIGLYINSKLCTGDFLDLVNFDIVGKREEIHEIKAIPYPHHVRGKVNLKYTFKPQILKND